MQLTDESMSSSEGKLPCFPDLNSLAFCVMYLGGSTPYRRVSSLFNKSLALAFFRKTVFIMPIGKGAGINISSTSERNI